MLERFRQPASDIPDLELPLHRHISFQRLVGGLINTSNTANRLGLVRMTLCLISGLLLCALCVAGVRGAQTESLEEKLATATEYVPTEKAPVAQLVEVALKFKIPMGIEWVEKLGPATRAKTIASEKRSVRELIEEILSVLPGYRMEVDDGLVRLYSPAEAVHPFNFLNIPLNSYSVKNDDLFAAEDRLRWAIRFTLEPEKYRNGYGGGYGHGGNEVFQIQKFTVSGEDITIREVLSRIARAQGNALWVATINGADFEGDEPRWRRQSVDSGDLPITSAWRFHPLAGIAELAKERVAVDLTITDLLDERMTTIPVMLDEGLYEGSGGGIGGSLSDDSSFSYGASLEEVGKDFVRLSVHLKVERRGELEFKFEKRFQVYRGRVTELRPEPRIRIRAYLERADKP